MTALAIVDQPEDQPSLPVAPEGSLCELHGQECPDTLALRAARGEVVEIPNRWR